LRVEQRRHVAGHTALKQFPLRPRIHNRRPELTQVPDRAFDDVDALLVGFGEQLLVHVFANDTDAHAVEAGCL
jgi:hypothetical protein